MTSVEEAVSDHSSSMEVPKVKLSTVPIDHEEQITSRDCSNGATTSDEINPISGDLDVANLEILKRNTDDTEESLKKICEVKDSVAVNETEAKDNEIVQDHQDIREGEILVTKSEVIDTSKAQEGVILRDSEVVDSVEEVDVQGQEHIESVEVKSKEENLSSDVQSGDVQSGEPEEFQDAEPETFRIDKRGSKHVFEETSSSAEDKDCVDKEELKDDRTKVDQIDQIEQLQKPSIEVYSEESEETSTKVDEKPKEEVRLQQESQEETKSVTEVAEEAQEETKSVTGVAEEAQEETKLVTEVAEEVQEETKSVPEVAEEVQEEKETELQKVEIEKHDSRTEEVSNAQQSLLEEIEAEEVEDKIQKSLEIVETAESQSSLAEDQEHKTVSEKTEDVNVKEIETTDNLSVPLEASRLEDYDTLKSEEKKGDEELSETEALESLSSSKTAENVEIKEEESRNLEAVKLEELREDKSLEFLETTKVIEPKSDQSLEIETSQADQTQSSEVESGLEDQTPKPVHEIQEEEAKKADDLEVTVDQNLPVEASETELESREDDKTSNLVEEIHEEKETKEVHKLEATADQSLPVEASQVDQTPLSEIVSGLDDQNPRQVEEIHEEDTKEPHKLDAVETSHEDQTSSSEIVSKLDDQTKQVEEYQVEEKHGAHKLETTIDQSLPVEISDQTPPSELVSKLDEESPKQIEEIHEEEAKKAYELEVTSDKSLPVETSQENQTPSSELVSESKQAEEIQEEDTKEAHKLVAVGDQSLPVEVSQVAQTPSSELVSGLDDNTPKKVEEIHEQEPQESHKLEAMADQSLPVETSQVDQIMSSELVSEVNDQKPKHVEEIQKEETEEAHKLEAVGDQRLPVEASQVDQTLSSELVSELNHHTPKQEDNHQEETKEVLANQSLPVDISHGDQTPLVSGLDDQTPKHVEEIHEDETKEAHKLQAEEIPLTETIPRELSSEAPVSMLASSEDEQVTLQEDNGASEVKETKDTQEEQLVSAETEENVGETKPKESKAEETEKSADQAKTSSYPLSSEKEIHENPDYPTLSKETGEAEHEDDTYSTLPVVGILKELQTTLETERAIEDSASSGEKMRLEPAEEVEKAEANEKYFDPSFEAEPEIPVTDISESITNEKQATTFAEEVGVSVEEKLQEDVKEIKENPVDWSLTEVLPCEKVLLATSAVLSEEPEHVFTTEKQEHTAEEDAYASTVEKKNLQEEQSRDFETSLQVDEVSNQIIEAEVPAGQPVSHETVEKDQISDIKEEKEEESHRVLGNEVEIDAVITPEKQITEPSESLKKASEAEHESNEEHVEPQAISDDRKKKDDRDSIPIEQAPKDQVEEEKTKKLESHYKEDNADELLAKEALDEQLQVPSSAFSSKQKEQVAEAVENSNPEGMTDITDQELSVQKPLELIQSQSPNLPLQEKVEETSFEVKKVQEDKDEEIVDASMKKENIHVQDQPKEFEAPSTNEDTNVKLEVHDDKVGGENLEEHSVVALKEETGLIEEKREIEIMKKEPEDAMKHGIDQQISVPLIASTDKALELKEENEEPENIQLTEATHKDELNKAPEQSQDLMASLEEKEIIKNEVSGEEKSDTYEKIDQSSISEATKEIYKEESKQTDTFTASKEESREGKNLSEGSEEIPAEKKTQDTMVLQKEIAQECFNSMKNIDDATEETKPEVHKPESLSSVNTTQDKSKEREELYEERSPSQQPREIAHEVKQEDLKIAGDGESKDADNTKDLFSEVKESESPPKEPARKSLSDLLHKVRGVKEASKVEDTTASHIEEDSKTEEEDGEEHKEDKTSPDSIVMVEAKDTANMIKTPHKKSHGILSGVGSKVKHSISKVKKAITGKSSHTKPSSPQ